MLLSRFRRSRTAPRQILTPDRPAGHPERLPIAAFPGSATSGADEGRDLESLPESVGPSGARSGSPRPALFAVRERGAPGREYGALLAMPGDLGQSARRARLLSVQGILHARQGRVASAREAFALAAAADPTVDFAALPTFWDLTRDGCQSAVAAYEDAGLPARAAELQTRISYVMRPRHLRLVRGDERRSS